MAPKFVPSDGEAYSRHVQDLREGLFDIWLTAVAWQGVVLAALLVLAIALCVVVARTIARLNALLEERDAELEEARQSLDATRIGALNAESKAKIAGLDVGRIEERLARIEAAVLGSAIEDGAAVQLPVVFNDAPPRRAVVEDVGGVSTPQWKMSSPA